MIELYGDLVLNKNIDIFCHQTNCFATMGAGIARQIAKIYPEVEANDYTYFHSNLNTNELLLGTILPTFTHDNRVCINMYSQYSTGKATPNTMDDSNHREQAFTMCLEKLHDLVVYDSRFSKVKSIGFPKFIGCGLAGGDWRHYAMIISLFEEELKNTLRSNGSNRDISIYIVNFKKEEYNNDLFV
jgi:O-acetyl-ADP-ribose deacetylase (regulator of RNase III)